MPVRRPARHRYVRTGSRRRVPAGLSLSDRREEIRLALAGAAQRCGDPVAVEIVGPSRSGRRFERDEAVSNAIRRSRISTAAETVVLVAYRRSRRSACRSSPATRAGSTDRRGRRRACGWSPCYARLVDAARRHALVRALDDHRDALGRSTSSIVLAICAVIFSWICRRWHRPRQRASFEIPTTRRSRQIGDVGPADDRHHVVLAMRLEADVASAHHLVIAVGLLEGALQERYRVLVIAG